MLEQFVKRIEDKNVCVNSVVVFQGGKQIGEYDRIGSRTRLNTWSASKSFVSVGVGIAIDEGIMRLDEHLCDSFADYLPENPSQNLLDITVHDMLTMTTGLENPLFFTDDLYRLKIRDWVGHFFEANFPYMPGQQYLYSNFNTYMLSCMIERKTGMKLVEYLRPRLFEKIDIFSPEWMCDPMGRQTAANGLYLNIDEMAHFGLMLLGDGVYGGRRVVSREYLALATKAQTTLPGSKHGYGYQFWINPGGESYRADGKFGQYIFVLPKKDAVIAVMSLEGKKTGEIFHAVWEEIAEKL